MEEMEEKCRKGAMWTTEEEMEYMIKSRIGREEEKVWKEGYESAGKWNGC